MPDNWFGIFLIYLVGLALALLELFIPSGGLLGIGATLCIIYALWQFCTINVWFGILAVAATVAYLIFVFRWGFRRLRMDTSLGAGVATGADVKEAQDNLIGTVGEAVTALRPAGVAVIEGRRFDVVTQGGFVEIGAKVKVIAADGNRIQVRGA